MASLACLLPWQRWLEAGLGWDCGLELGACLSLRGHSSSRVVNFLLSCPGLPRSVPAGQVGSKASQDWASEVPGCHFLCIVGEKEVTKANPGSWGDERNPTSPQEEQQKIVAAVLIYHTHPTPKKNVTYSRSSGFPATL